MLKGSDYVAVVRITDAPGNVLAAPGQTCERVPSVNLESLARRGRIKRVERPAVMAPPMAPRLVTRKVVKPRGEE